MKAYKVILTHKESLQSRMVVFLATDWDGLQVQIAMQFPEYDWYVHKDDVYDVV